MIKKIFSIPLEPFAARISKGASVSLAVKIAGVLVTYLFSITVSNLFGADRLGLFFIGATFVDVFATVSLLGFDQAIVLSRPRNGTGSSREESPLFATLVVASAAAIFWGSVLFLSRDAIAKHLFPNVTGLQEYIAVFALAIIPISIIKICANYYRKQHNFLSFSVLIYFATYLFALITLLLTSNLGSVAVPVSFFAGSLVTAICALALLRKEIFTPSTTLKKFGGMGGYIWFSVPFMGSELLAGVFGWLIILAAGISLMSFQTGVFGLITKIVLSLTFFSTAVNAALLPSIVKSEARKNRARMLEELVFGWKTVMLSTTISAVLLIVFAPFLLNFVGGGFGSGLWPLILLCLAQIVEAAVSLSSSLLPALHKQKHLFAAGAVKSAAFILLLSVFQSDMNMERLALFVLISVIFAAMYLIFASSKHIRALRTGE